MHWTFQPKKGYMFWSSRNRIIGPYFLLCIALVTIFAFAAVTALDEFKALTTLADGAALTALATYVDSICYILAAFQFHLSEENIRISFKNTIF